MKDPRSLMDLRIDFNNRDTFNGVRSIIRIIPGYTSVALVRDIAPIQQC